MGLLSLAPAYWYWQLGNPNWQTILFPTLTFAQMAHVLATRTERQSLFQTGLLSNKPLLGAVLLTVLLHAALVYIPFLQEFFSTTPLSMADLALTVAVSSIVFFAVELEKWVSHRRLGL